MFEDYFVTFGALFLAGLLIMILGLRITGDWRRSVETLGAIILHVGVFGILYHKVSLILFVSLVCLMLSIFVLMDPLKLSTYIQPKVYRATGYLLLLTAIAFFAMYFTNFPVWLWGAPLLAYLIPYALPPLKPKLWLLHTLAWLLVIANMTIISYAAYTRLHPDTRYADLVSWFQPLSIKPMDNPVAPETIIVPLEETATTTSAPDEPIATERDTKLLPVHPVEEPDRHDAIVGVPDMTERDTTDTSENYRSLFDDEEGPFLQSLKQADEKFLELRRDYDRLSDKLKRLSRENERLQDELEKYRKTDITRNL